MSSIESMPDELSAKMGGQEPYFYAFCQVYWSRLGNLTTLSADPRLQIADNPLNFPSVESYQLAQDSKPAKGVDESAPNSTHISMASWVQNTIKWGFSDREQRFLITKKEDYMPRQNEVSSLTTQYLIGRNSILRSVLHINNAKSSLTSSYGIEVQDVEPLVHDMTSPKHEAVISMALKLRENSRVQRDIIEDTLPDWKQILRGRTNSINHVIVDDKPVHMTAVQVANLAKLELSKLPIEKSVELLHYKVLIGTVAVGLLMLPGQTGTYYPPTN